MRNTCASCSSIGVTVVLAAALGAYACTSDATSRQAPQEVLGKPVDGVEVKAIVGDFYKSCTMQHGNYYECPLAGVDLATTVVDDQLRVTQIKLYLNPLAGRYRAYAGPIPHGIERSDRVADLRAKLGDPAVIAGATDIYDNLSPKMFIQYYSDTSPQPGLVRTVALALASK